MRIIKSLLIVGALFFAAPAFSQFSIGAQGSYLKFFGEMSDYSFTGVGLKVEYGITSKLSVNGGFNYYLKKSEEYSNTYRANDAPYTATTVTSKSTVNTIHLGVNAKYYFVGENDENFGFYGVVGVGFMMIPVSYEVGDYDKEQYTVEAPYDETFTNLMLSFGVGIEAKVGPVYIFGEPILNLPPTEVEGQAVAIDISGSAAINVGVRFPLEF